MNKLFLMKHPDLFQGEKNLSNNKNYFEGWYFKNTNNENGISFIPGINIDGKAKEIFIQVITNTSSYFIKYDINDFKFNFDPFYIKIEDNYFSKDSIHVNIKDNSQDLNIVGDIYYMNNKNINTNMLNPNIMGPFSYVPFMECNHAILSMQNEAFGLININDNKLDFNNSIGYIEKDWGYSFPKSYIWCQGNMFKNKSASFMFSMADIPFKLFNFKGLISVLIVDNKEYKFTTYNNSKIIKNNITDNSLDIVLKKGSYTLTMHSIFGTSLKLSAPVKGRMAKEIFESICSSVTVTLKNNNEIIFSDTSSHCGLEIVQN